MGDRSLDDTVRDKFGAGDAPTFRLYAGRDELVAERIWQQHRWMPEPPGLRDGVRRALLDGALPRLDDTRARAGYGTGRPCCACALVIRRRDIQYEVEAGGVIPVHAECFRIWREESRTLPLFVR